MATKTFEELKQLAIQIRDEKTNKQNTATRIGTQMLEHLDKLEQDYYDKTATDEELKERDEKLTELANKKYLRPLSITPGYYINNSGELKTYDKIAMTEFLLIPQKKPLYLEGIYMDGISCMMGFLDRNFNILSTTLLETGSSKTINPGDDFIPDSAYYLCAFARYGQGSNFDKYDKPFAYSEEDVFTGLSYSQVEKKFSLLAKKGYFISNKGELSKYNTDSYQTGSAVGICVFRLFKNVNFKISNIWFDSSVGANIAFLDEDRNIVGFTTDNVIKSDVLINTDELIAIAPETTKYFVVSLKGSNSILYSNVDLRDNTDLVLSEKVNNGKITGDRFDYNLKYFQLHTYKGFYINKNGNIIEYTTEEVNYNAQGITPLLRLYANITLQISNYWNDGTQGADVAFFDSEYNLIGVSNDFGYTSRDSITLNTNDLIEIAPEGSIYFALNVKGEYCTLLCDVDISCYGDFITKNMTSNTIEDLIAKGVSYTEQDGYLDKGGNYADTENFHSKTSIKYSCKEGYRFFYKGSGKIAAQSWIFYKNNKIVSYGQIESLYEYTEVVIPEGVDFVVFSSFSGKNSEVVLDVKMNVIINVNTDSNNSNILYSKKWYCGGDSYSEGDYTNSPNPESTKFTDGIYAGKNKVYSRFIALRNNMDLHLLAKCGATCGAWKEDVEAGTVDTPTHTNTFYYNQLPQILSNEDKTFNGYITLWFCINDGSHCTLGTIDDETVNTFYGALNWSAIQLITNFPLAKIGFIVSNNANSSYQQAVREVAQKWAIPYLDMEGDPQIPTISGKRTNQDIPVDSRVRTLRWDNNFRVASNNGHPNEIAHEYQSTFIENWLRSL